MQKVLFSIIGVLFVCAIGIGIFAITHSSLVSVTNTSVSDTTTQPAVDTTGIIASTTTETPDTTGSTSTASPDTYTLADVAAHATEQSCYTAINGSVYDLTSFISLHPGGVENIMKICGIDGTAQFEAQHGNTRSAQAELATLKIGTLVQ